MNRRVLIVFGLLLAVVGGLLGIGVIPWPGGATQTDGESGSVAREAGAASGASTPLKGGATPAREIPAEEPPPQRLRLERPLKTVFLVERLTSYPMFIANALREDPLHHFTSWSANPVRAEPSMSSDGQPPIVQRPTAAWLAEYEPDVLVVAGLDPDVLDDAFWQAVADRVRARTLGLFVIPGWPAPPEGQAVSPEVHPMLGHSLLAGLLPIESAQPLRGVVDPATGVSRVPGTFPAPADAPFQVTEAGAAHVVSRIVAFPEWSVRIWQQGASSASPWGSKFVYPVEKLRAGSRTLVEAKPTARGRALPVYVLGPDAGGRVLWFGAWDFGEVTYRDPRATERWAALFHNAVIFLAGRAPPEEP